MDSAANVNAIMSSCGASQARETGSFVDMNKESLTKDADAALTLAISTVNVEPDILCCPTQAITTMDTEHGVIRKEFDIPSILNGPSVTEPENLTSLVRDEASR